MMMSSKPSPRSRKLGVFNAAGRKISSWIGLGQHQLMAEQLMVSDEEQSPSCRDVLIHNHHHLTYSKQVSSTPSSPTSHNVAEKQFQFTKVFKKKSV